jgi:hypothetical protein
MTQFITNFPQMQRRIKFPPYHVVNKKNKMFSFRNAMKLEVGLYNATKSADGVHC